MGRIRLNDRYIRGTISFQNNGNKANFSYVNTGLPTLPLNAQYELEGQKWKVIAVKTSNYNSFVTNVDLELINGG